MKLITHEQGLSDNQVTSLAQDKIGYLWIGTTGGLNRFDGNDFKVFRSDLNDSNSLVSDYIVSLSVDANDDIWIGHLIEGVTLYEHKTGNFKRFKEIQNTVNCFFFQGKYVWMGLGQNGFCRFNPETRERISFSLTEHMNKAYTGQDKRNLNTVNTFLKDSSGLFWLGTNDGLYSFNTATNELKPHRLAKDGPGENRDDLISAMYYDAETNIIYTPALHGIKAYHISTGAIDFYGYPNDNPNFFLTRITGFQQKSKDEFWINSADQGLAIFNVSSKKFDFSVSKGQPIYPGMLLNTKDRLWIGCGVGLVSVSLEKKIFSVRSVSDPKHKGLYIADIYFDSALNKRFFATEDSDGLIVTDWDEKNYRNYLCKVNRALDGYVISKLINLDDRFLLVASRDYIQLFDKVKETWVDLDQDGTTNNVRAYFSTAVQDAEGKVWITSKNDGVRLYDPKLKTIEWFTFNPQKKSRIGSNRVRGVIMDPWKRIWIATADTGLEIFDPAKREFININDLDGGVKIPPFKDLEAIAMGEDSTVWLGSIGKGLYKIKLRDKKIVSFSSSSLSTSVAQIVIDDDGLVWIMQAGGAWIPQYGENVVVYDPRKNLSKHFTPSSRQYPFYGITKIGDSAAITGVNCYYIPINMVDNFSAAKKTIVINSLKIDGKEIGFDPMGGKISLAYDQNSILIQFSAIDFCDPTNTQYSFKMEGLETKWNNVSSNQRVATYSKLPPGKYIFKMKVNNPYLGVPKEADLIYISISPPFWKTWWFVAASSVVLTLSFYLFVIYLINRGVKEESLKKKLSNAQLIALRTQMNPHFIFNSLNAIQGLIIRSDIPKATQFTARFSKLIRKVLENSERQLISVMEEIDTLELYLSIESIRFEGRFHYDIKTDDGILAEEIPSMVIQPIVENAIWQNLSHANTGKYFYISFKRNVDQIICTIRHDVDGITKNQSLALPEKSVGLKLTASRLVLISSGSVIKERDEVDHDNQVKAHVIDIIFDMKSMTKPKQAITKERSVFS